MEVVGYAIHSGTQWRTVRTIKGGGTVVVGIEKKFFFIRPVGLQFLPYGGKTGRAMIKYPPYKKNAQPYKRSLYPGFKTVSLDR